MVEGFGRGVCPFIMKRNVKDGTEGFSFRAADVIICLLKSGKVLDGEAMTRAIRLVQSLDGALFTKNLSHTLIGIKFNDPTNPYAQSRDSVFPVGCIALPESTSMVHGVFSRVFAEIREATEKVIPNAFENVELVLVTNCDMSCDWKLMGRGGAAKQHKFPCSKCTVQSGKLHQRTGKPANCDFCIQLGRGEDPTWICRHTKMCTEKYVKELKKEVKDFRESTMPQISKDIKALRNESQLSINHDPRLDPTDEHKTNITCIHFDLSVASSEQRSEYSKRITNDLRIRRLPLFGSLEVRQQRLKSQQLAEWEYIKAYECLQDMKSSKKMDALVMMLDSIPCLLHLENRMGIKFLGMCLKSGLTIAKSAENATDVTIQAFLDKVAGVMNTEVIGSTTQPTQWKVPFDKTDKKIGDITMDNVRIRKVLKNFDALVYCCLVDPLKKKQFKKAVSSFRSGMKKVNVRHDLSDPEIISFQRDMDDFFAEWCTLYGEDGITNYAHMLGSGHIMEYLLHWRNLWVHFQQGWEGKFPCCCREE